MLMIFGAISHERNEYVKTEGSVDTNLYFVTEGTLRVFFRAGSDEHCLYFGYPSSVISALDSFLTERPSDYYIQALKKSTLEVVAKSDFNAYIAANKQGAAWWNQVLKELLLRQQDRERDLFEASPAERYHRALKRQPQLFQHIPHKYLASYLRMAPETLSRIQKS